MNDIVNIGTIVFETVGGRGLLKLPLGSSALSNTPGRIGLMDYTSCTHLQVLCYTGLAGHWNTSVAEAVRHNRTMNKNGGAGRNISVDRFNEHLNKEIKGM